MLRELAQGLTHIPSIGLLDWYQTLIIDSRPHRPRVSPHEQDPEEKNSLAQKEPELTSRLHKRLIQWQTQLSAACPTAPNPNYDPSAVKQKGRDQRNKGGRKK